MYRIKHDFMIRLQRVLDNTLLKENIIIDLSIEFDPLKNKVMTEKEIDDKLFNFVVKFSDREMNELVDFIPNDVNLSKHFFYEIKKIFPGLHSLELCHGKSTSYIYSEDYDLDTLYDKLKYKYVNDSDRR